MTFKGILDVFIYHILRVKYTLNLSYNMYVSSFKYLFTYPFFGSADCLLCVTPLKLSTVNENFMLLRM